MKKVGFYGGKFLPLHTGHVLSAIEALKYVDELFVSLEYNKERDAELCKQSGCKEMPYDVRLSWLGYCLKDYPQIKIISVEDNMKEYDFLNKEVLLEHRKYFPKLDYVFSSEPGYDIYFKQLYPEAQHIILDEGRNFVKITGTECRNNIYKNWNYLPKIVRKHFVKKVLITGVESVGKSTMVHKLGTYFNTTGVQEVGRKYCEDYKNCISIEHFDNIAMEHWLKQDDACYNANEFMFVDSDAIVTQYYLDKYHPGHHSDFIDSIIKKQNYDYIFYLEPTVKWVDDGYRFLELSQKEDNSYLRNQYIDQGIINIIYSDDYNQRFKDIIKCLSTDSRR